MSISTFKCLKSDHQVSIGDCEDCCDYTCVNNPNYKDCNKIKLPQSAY